MSNRLAPAHGRYPKIPAYRCQWVGPCPSTSSGITITGRPSGTHFDMSEAQKIIGIGNVGASAGSVSTGLVTEK